MAVRDFLITVCSALLLTPIFLWSLSVAGAQVMESSSYKIESDSINFGGGLSSSTSYVLESTLGEVGTGESGSANFNLRAGYLQMTGRSISMTAPSPVVMAPTIPGITGGASNGSTTVTVTTDSAAGYSLSIKSESSPAMVKGADTIADYAPAGLDPDFDFTVGAGEAYFGYSPSGVDVDDRFLDNGSACNTGSQEADLQCWDGLTTSDVVVAEATSGNVPDGATTTINFRVRIGSGANQPAGIYTATTTLTAVAL